MYLSTYLYLNQFLVNTPPVGNIERLFVREDNLEVSYFVPRIFTQCPFAKRPMLLGIIILCSSHLCPMHIYPLASSSQYYALNPLETSAFQIVQTGTQYTNKYFLNATLQMQFQLTKVSSLHFLQFTQLCSRAE